MTEEFCEDPWTNAEFSSVFRCTRSEINHLRAAAFREMSMKAYNDDDLLNKDLGHFDPDGSFQRRMWEKVGGDYTTLHMILGGARWPVDQLTSKHARCFALARRRIAQRLSSMGLEPESPEPADYGSPPAGFSPGNTSQMSEELRRRRADPSVAPGEEFAELVRPTVAPEDHSEGEEHQILRRLDGFRAVREMPVWRDVQWSPSRPRVREDAGPSRRSRDTSHATPPRSRGRRGDGERRRAGVRDVTHQLRELEQPCAGLSADVTRCGRSASMPALPRRAVVGPAQHEDDQIVDAIVDRLRTKIRRLVVEEFGARREEIEEIKGEIREEIVVELWQALNGGEDSV